MPMDYSRYPIGWKKVSLTIRRIAANRCEWCHVANGSLRPNGSRVVLTVAHLGTVYADGKPGNKHNTIYGAKT